ncbi:MAG: hypothetical protein Ct9H300mP32_3310 [Verrucomicrobiota bacterium]|nr:MAG: hypothetical protein Ct9H300mP32_3310 [Verrucomicrobiota bacterium]
MEQPAGRIKHALHWHIRTRTFGVNGDMLWYRYKGKADVFLAVNSHRQIAGPLHGIVRQKLEARATSGSGMAIVCATTSAIACMWSSKPKASLRSTGAVRGQRAPVVRPANSRLTKLLESDGDLAAGLARVLKTAANDCAVGQADRETAQLLNWVIRHDNLLEKPADLGEATAKFAAYQKGLSPT